MQATCLCFKMASIEKMRFSSQWHFNFISLLMNLIIHLFLNVLSKLQRNEKSLQFCQTHQATAQYWLIVCNDSANHITAFALASLQNSTKTDSTSNDSSSKESLHFDDQSKQVVFLFSLQCSLKEIKNMFSMFLPSYTLGHSSLCPHSTSDSPKLSLIFQGSKFSFGFGSTCATRCKFLGALLKFQAHSSKFQAHSFKYQEHLPQKNINAPNRATQASCCNMAIFQQH